MWRGLFSCPSILYSSNIVAGHTWTYCIEESLRNPPFLPRPAMCLFIDLKSHQIPATWLSSCARHCLSAPCLLWPPVHVELPGRNSQIVFFYGRLVLPVKKEQPSNILTEMHQKSLSVLNIAMGLQWKLTGIYTHTFRWSKGNHPLHTTKCCAVCDNIVGICTCNLFHPSLHLLFLQLYLYFPLGFLTVFFTPLCKANLNHLKNHLSFPKKKHQQLPYFINHSVRFIVHVCSVTRTSSILLKFSWQQAEANWFPL